MSAAQRNIWQQSLLSNDSEIEHVLPSSYDSKQATGSTSAQAFWLNAAKLIDWVKPPTIAYGKDADSNEEAWFPDGVLNTCYNTLDRHCLPTPQSQRPGNRPCIQHVSPLSFASKRPQTTLTYEQVLAEVKAIAGVLRHTLGVKKGDTVVIYSQ